MAMKRAEEERRARKVALTRSYRKGDLPDIQVLYKFENRTVNSAVSGVLCRHCEADADFMPDQHRVC